MLLWEKEKEEIGEKRNNTKRERKWVKIISTRRRGKLEMDKYQEKREIKKKIKKDLLNLKK